MDITTGGSISIPIETSTEATSMSTITNGKNIRNPIMKATFNSLTTNAGISHVVGTSFHVIFYLQANSLSIIR